MKKIQSKITLTYVLLTFLVITGVGVLSSATLEAYFRDRMVETIASRAEVIMYLLRQETGLTPAILDRQMKDVARIAQLRITLIDSSGRVIADTEVPLDRVGEMENHLDRPEVETALLKGVGSDRRQSASVGEDFLYVAKLVRNPPQEGILTEVRFVRVSIRLEELRQTVADIRWNILMVGLLVLLIVIGVSIILSRRISRPMVQIAGSVKEIQKGNLDTRVPVASSDEIGQVAAAVNDMAEKLSADRIQLGKLERMRSEFLGNVSHELRTPLFSLQGYIETLLNGAIDDPSVNRAFLKKAYNHSARLNSLLGDLITISQIESGEMKMSFRYFALQEFLNSVAEDFQGLATLHQVTLRLMDDLPESLDVLGDKDRLRVALDNLVDNAIKYNRPGGEVIISTEQRRESVRIKVADTGVGISVEHTSRIFERFYRVDKARSSEVGGTGLGLAIVKHIIEAHGSTVDVASTPDSGSAFTFELKT